MPEQPRYQSPASASENTAQGIELSSSVQEIISGRPSYFDRKGTIIIFGILLIMISGMSFIHYPDALEGTAVITTNPLPLRLKAANPGRLALLFVPDNQSVTKNQPIAELQNNIGYDAILAISSIADSSSLFLKQGNIIGLHGLLNHPLTATGEAQPYYNQLLQSISAYLLLNNEHIYNRRIESLQQQVGRYHSVANITINETRLNREELQESKERFAANEQLYKDKVISKQEFFDEETRLRQKQLAFEATRKTTIQNNITAGENSKQLSELEYDKAEQERTLRIAIEEALRNLQNYVQSWKLQYLLVAPYNGMLHYLRPLQVNEPTNAGDELFAIIPSNYHYTAQVYLSSNGFGKVKEGQVVQLKLAQYPYNEFGYLLGKISKISVLPQMNVGNRPAQTEASYLVDVALPDTLVTTYHIPIKFSPEMSAQARIITKDRSLLQRLLNGVAGMRE